MAAGISIIVRCFNEEAHLGRLLNGIAAQTVSAELIVVDSGSTDSSRQIARENGAQIIAIPPEEFSFGRALNRGCEAASGSILVFISAHCYPIHDEWLERLVAPFEDERVASVYGLQRGVAGTKFSEHRIFEQWFPEVSDPNQEHAFCNNANCAARRLVWEENAYDEGLTGLEDVAWANDALLAGYRVVYEATAGIYHVHDESPRRILNRYRREAIALRSIFPHEGFGFLGFLRSWSSSIWADLVVARRVGRLVSSSGEILMFRTMQFLGALIGFRQQGPVNSELKRRFYYALEPLSAENSAGTTGVGRVIDYSAEGETER